jgi:hypothetical protein
MKRTPLLLLVATVLLVLPLALTHAQPSLFTPDKMSRGFTNPFLEGAYGVGVDSHKGFDGTFAPTGIFELRIGYRDVLKKKGALDLDEKFAYGGYSKSDYSLIKSDSGDVKNEMIRFGIGARAGYGYRLGFMDLIPYGGYSFDFSESKFTQTGPISPADSAFLTRVAGTYRFGESFDAGIQLRLFRSLSANIAGHGQIVFPRVIFPEWVCSYLIMASSLVIISEFSDDIVNSSSFLGPIMYFILRNGVAYGFYAAMKSQMHWPFTSESPLAVESVKLSAMIEF